MAEDERLRILARNKGGMAAAKAKGIKLGHKPSSQRISARRPGVGWKPARARGSIAKKFGVHHATVLLAMA